MQFRIKSRALAAAFCVSVSVVAGMLPTLVHADDKPHTAVLSLIVPFGPASGANQLALESVKLLAGVLPAEIKITNVLDAVRHCSASSHDQAAFGAFFAREQPLQNMGRV